MVNLTVLNTLSFGTYAFLREQVKTHLAGGEELNAFHYALAGIGVGIGSVPVSTPFELVKVRLQLDNVREKRLKGSFHCMRDLVSRYGPRSLMCGTVVNGWREVIFCAFYFSIYETIKKQVSYFVPGRDGHSPMAIMLGGGFAGVAGWLSSFPLDVIKSIIQACHYFTIFFQPVANIQLNQAQEFSTPYKPRLKIVNVAKSIWKEKGLRGFYSGITPSLVRAFLVSGIRFSAYESMLVFLTRIDQPNF